MLIVQHDNDSDKTAVITMTVMTMTVMMIAMMFKTMKIIANHYNELTSNSVKHTSSLLMSMERIVAKNTICRKKSVDNPTKANRQNSCTAGTYVK